MIRLTPIFVSLLVSIVFLVTDAFACQCSTKPTIIKEMAFSGVVVTGQIESVHKIREEQRQYDYEAYRSATLVVDKVYSGNVRAGDRLVLAQSGGADCAFTWDDGAVGSKWLLYLGQPSTEHYRYLEGTDEIGENEKVPMYRTSFCGRSTTINSTSAAQDLAYLVNLTKFKGKTRISGALDFGERSVEGIEVRITGKNAQFKTKYVKGGFFEMYDIPPGEYLIEVFPPRGWKAVNDWRYMSAVAEYSSETREKLKKNQRLIRVGNGGHVDVDLALAPDTMIKGRILSPTNKPMANVWVSAVPVYDHEKAREGQARTDAKGEFQIETLDPGNYILVANRDGKIDDERPFGRLYYPGVTTKEHAGLIAVEPGKYALGVDIQVPQTTRLIEITGQILFADDVPGKQIWVSFEPLEKEVFEKISARTDDTGRFSLRIPYGAAGVVRGSRYFSEYSYSKCSEIMEAVKASGSSDIRTTVLEITGTEPITTALLRFPFDFCEEK